MTRIKSQKIFGLKWMCHLQYTYIVVLWIQSTKNPVSYVRWPRTFSTMGRMLGDWFYYSRIVLNPCPEAREQANLNRQYRNIRMMSFLIVMKFIICCWAERPMWSTECKLGIWMNKYSQHSVQFKWINKLKLNCPHSPNANNKYNQYICMNSFLPHHWPLLVAYHITNNHTKQTLTTHTRTIVQCIALWYARQVSTFWHTIPLAVEPEPNLFALLKCMRGIQLSHSCRCHSAQKNAFHNVNVLLRLNSTS